VLKYHFIIFKQTSNKLIKIVVAIFFIVSDVTLNIVFQPYMPGGCNQTEYCVPTMYVGVAIRLPGFNGSSYASYPTTVESLTTVQIHMTFLARSLEDALLLYSAYDFQGTSDFIALAIRNGYLEFQYDLGSGYSIDCIACSIVSQRAHSQV